MANTETVHISKLTPDARNANKGTERGNYMLGYSLETFGAGRSLLLDKNLNIIAGNKTHGKAGEQGIENVILVHTTGDQLVAVVRDDLDINSKEARGLAIADNQVAVVDIAFDGEELARLQLEGVDLGPMFREDELDALFDDAAGIGGDGDGTEAPEPQIDRAEELQRKWGTERGQLWQIGRHRLLCGDSTNAADVARLFDNAKLRMVWTDPPYGVSYGAKNEFLNAIAPGNRIQTPIENDQMSECDTEKLATDALTLAHQYGEIGASIYVACPPGTLLPHFIAAVAASGFQYKHSLVWVKNQFVLGRCDYHYRHEIVLYGWKKGAHYFVDNHTKDSVFEINKPYKSDMHPTTKPVELITEMVQNSSKPGEIVYDPFNGSGSTLCAAESTGRTGYGIELTPGYVAVTLERLSQMGLTPELIDGQT
jgi:DNA modification methylase